MSDSNEKKPLVKLRINGIPVEASPEETILSIAGRIGVDIPRSVIIPKSAPPGLQGMSC